MGALRQYRTQVDRKKKQRRRGRQADPDNVRFVLRCKFGDRSCSRFAALIAAKKWTLAAGGRRVRLPGYTTVLRFCRGDAVDERTFGLLCDELGVPFSVLEKGSTISESDLKDTRYKSGWSFCHPASYSGPVWIEVVPKFENRAAPHHYTVRWGPWEYTGVLNLRGLESAALIHMKGNDGLSIPIFFDIRPPCCVSFGQGQHPTGLVHDINHGWSRVEEGVFG